MTIVQIGCNDGKDHILDFCQNNKEGLDCEIILNFDIKKYNIRRIEFETLHSDGFLTKGNNYNSCIEKLKTLGYKATEAGEYNEAYEL